MISSFIAQNFAISDDYWVWNEKRYIFGEKMYYHSSNHDGYYDGYHDGYSDGYHDQPWLPS